MVADGVLFDERFLDRHAGTIISDTATAIVELVANAGDAYATDVEITWPDRHSKTLFSISDNGKGMTGPMFEKRWRKLDYNRVSEDGNVVDPPEEISRLSPRKVYGRNGRGRHAAFRFSDPYTVTTWRDGVALTYEIRRGVTNPFDVALIYREDGVEGHGTTVAATGLAEGVALTVDEVKEVIGTRFLADPNFRVYVDGVLVTFDDLPSVKLREINVPVEPYGMAHLIVVDAIRADKTTRHHGIAWRVNSRLVGTPSWIAFDQERLLDGRKTEAKRFQVIVQADFLEDHVLEDWSAFRPNSDAWKATRSAVHTAVLDFLSAFGSAAREETKEAIRESFAYTMGKLTPVGRA